MGNHTVALEGAKHDLPPWSNRRFFPWIALCLLEKAQIKILPPKICFKQKLGEGCRTSRVLTLCKKRFMLLKTLFCLVGTKRKGRRKGRGVLTNADEGGEGGEEGMHTSREQ